MLIRQIILCWPIYVIAACLIIGGIAGWKGLRSKTWPHTVGQVELSIPKGWLFRGAKVVYAYTVNGVEYRGKKLAFGPIIKFSMPGKPLAQYREGKQVTVYYNPNDPSQAVLEPGAKYALYPLLFGLLMVVSLLAGYFQ